MEATPDMSQKPIEVQRQYAIIKRFEACLCELHKEGYDAGELMDGVATVVGMQAAEQPEPDMAALTFAQHLMRTVRHAVEIIAREKAAAR